MEEQSLDPAVQEMERIVAQEIELEQARRKNHDDLVERIRQVIRLSRGEKEDAGLVPGRVIPGGSE